MTPLSTSSPNIHTSLRQSLSSSTLFQHHHFAGHGNTDNDGDDHVSKRSRPNSPPIFQFNETPLDTPLQSPKMNAITPSIQLPSLKSLDLPSFEKQ
jgi:hypothetical protein